MAFPDFLILGAMKCGTSTLAAQLARQPGVFMTTPKEPNFFSDDAVYAQGHGWYQSLFDAAQPGDLKGEASTHYTKRPTYPETLTRLSETLDTPKFIYLIRNPVERAISHYIHDWTQGVMSGGFEAALEQHSELIDYGRYGYQLTPWVERYGAERFFVTSLEAMEADPQAVLSALGAFLGTSRPLVWQMEADRQNASAERIRRLPMHNLIFDNPVATTLRRRLVPQSLRDRIKKSRQMQDRPEIEVRMRTRLDAAFAEDRQILAALIGENPAVAIAYRS